MGFVYRMASPSEYLAITGYGINDDVKLAKKAWIALGQRCTRFDISPVNYTFEVHAMSTEKLPFILAAVFTIGPRADDEECLRRYAKLIISPSTHDNVVNLSHHHVKELVKGVIEGETLALAASMTMEEIFRGTGTKEFMEALLDNVQLELNQFGLIIYNANVKQMVDVPGHEYCFSYLGQKTEINRKDNQAKVDVAEARMKGEVGAKERDGTTRQNAAKVDAETKVYTVKRQGEGAKEEAMVNAEVKVFENEREAEMAAANSVLAIKHKAGWEQQAARVAEVEAAKAVAIRDAELQVERRNARQTEKLKAVVDYEMKVEVERRDAARQTEKHRAYEMKEVQSNERPNKIDDIMESIRRACKSLKQLSLQLMDGKDTTAVQLEQRKKSWLNYTLKALLFACTMLFSAYMNLSSSTSITIKILLVVDIVVFIIINAVLLIKLPNWGNALACISWFLLELGMCLLILPFNGCYALAILAMLFLIVVVILLQPKFQHSVKKYVLPSFTTDAGDAQGDNGDQENHYLNHLFDISNGIATCGGLVTGILGYYSYMVGPVTAAGFFFFCTVLLGLYLMMVIAMRAVSSPHAACLAIVLKVLLLLTIITASISFVHHSVTNPQAVN